MQALRLYYVVLLLFIATTARAAGQFVQVLVVDGPITPTVAGYVQRGIDDAERNGAQAVVLQLDTPGGLDDSMRKIIQRINASKVPVVVYVYPSGGRAASAGMFITQAAHVAAMAPDTNIGSAHPVQLGGGGLLGGDSAPDQTMTQKVENDAVALVRSLAATHARNADWAEQAVRQSVNVPASEALEKHVVDVIAPSYPALLNQIDGRDVALGDGSHVTLHTANAELRQEPMTFAEGLIARLSDPNVAYLLLTLGFYGLIYELANPGTWIPGTVGIAAIVVALYALGTLPVNWAGVALIGLAFALFAADVLVTSGHGALTAAGALTLLLGSLFIFSGATPGMQLSPWVVGGVVLASSGFFVFVVGAAYRTRRRPVAVGAEALLGQVGTVMVELAPVGQIEVAGEIWRAELAGSGAPVPRGQRVRVVGRHGLTLDVQPAA